MKKKILITATAFLLGISVNAQVSKSLKANDKAFNETQVKFTQRMNEISEEIDLIVERNKSLLKADLNTIQNSLDHKSITQEQADNLRIEKSDYYASKIEEETKVKEEEIRSLINAKIDNNINIGDKLTEYQNRLIEKKTVAIIDYAFGKSFLTNNISDIKGTTLSSFGVGIGAKTRLGSHMSNYYWKSNLSFTGSFFKIENNQTIENNNGTTELVPVAFPVKKSLMNMLDFKLANHIEYDFSKKMYDEFGNKIIKSRQSFYIGAGGFIGYSQLNKQLLYEKNGEEYTQTTLSKFNVNHFTYGLSAYVGYKNISLRGTYHLNNVFKKSFADQNLYSVNLVFEFL